ncbi:MULTISPECIES: RICIN domain-containing protein [Streptomyces]|uniref:RICIN domain-containing protein n=1 Tax=Streptomyces TaxID=1883 RepID=UPI001E42097B|nr:MULTISPECIES: RICIN domain-containing protein [Streptomyces]UFQ13702.1 RICIN domain-containing protein [Streptomyces huasconensis]WCL83297.1 RICIN domain-containing protein [Streptomyces sp. JCM 35825]
MRRHTHQQHRKSPPGRALMVAWVVGGLLAAFTVFPSVPAAAADRSALAADSHADINIVALHSGMCLEVGSTASGEPVRQRNCAGKRGALWTLRQSPMGSDLVRIVNPSSGLCMAVADSSSADGAAVRQGSCGAEPGVDFRMVDSGEGAWLQPMTASPRKCVGITDSSTADRAELRQWSCTGTAGIRFQQRRPPHEWRTTIVNSTSGKCLGMRNASHVELEWAVQRTCSGSADETWRIVALDGGSVAIVNVNSDKCLMATRDTNGAPGSQAKQATCDGYSYQRWSLEEQSPGVYALSNHFLRQYLGVRPPVTADAALAEFWERSPDRGQEWRIDAGEPR